MVIAVAVLMATVAVALAARWVVSEWAIVQPVALGMTAQQQEEAQQLVRAMAGVDTAVAAAVVDMGGSKRASARHRGPWAARAVSVAWRSSGCMG